MQSIRAAADGSCCALALPHRAAWAWVAACRLQLLLTLPPLLPAHLLLLLLLPALPEQEGCVAGAQQVAVQQVRNDAGQHRDYQEGRQGLR